MTAAIVLVGGTARRMGGLAKPLLTLDGRTLLARTVAALESVDAAPVIAVGPVLDPDAAVRWVREAPPSGGPVAGIGAALDALAVDHDEVDDVFVLAGDLVRPDDVVARLAEARGDADADVDGWVFLADGQPQWLAGRYRAPALRAALSRLGTVQGASMRGLLGALALDWLVDGDGTTADIDAPADLARARGEREETS